MKIFLNKYDSKKSSNVNNSIPIQLTNRNRIIPIDHLSDTINEIELYNNERLTSNNIRLTCTIKPICSNVLFNNITEIIKDEGSDHCQSLNYVPLNQIQGSHKLIHKSSSMFTSAYDGVRDSQLSNADNNFIYHCGLDMFNNHIMRSKTFKTVCKLQNSGMTSSTFNTIDDFARTVDGQIMQGYSDVYKTLEKPDINLHLYITDDIMTFKECVSNRLLDENGWLGFTNIGKFGTYDSTNEIYDIYKVINSRKSCDFVDMCPERDLWYFTPKYNKFKNKIEKNWHYCLTYPSSRTTNVDFIRATTNSLKISMFDDTLENYVGTSGLLIYSIAKHGLKKGDYVNIYQNDNILMRNAEVVNVTDEYIFSVYDNGVEISKNWRVVTANELKAKSFIYNNKHYEIKGNKKYYAIANDENIKFPILPSNKVNLDASVLDLSYKKVESGEEVEYYVRLFSRLPNWKYSSIKPSEYELYKANSTLIQDNQTVANEFESHIGKLAFSKTIYNDDVTEIVFTDNIDIQLLKDHLGRPLTSIYLTIIKNNQGYKEWYGIDKQNTTYSLSGDTINTSDSNIEYSHIFGKLTCGFQLSEYSTWNDELINVNTINRIDRKYGLNTRVINENFNNLDVDEIQYNPKTIINDDITIHYKGDTCFYGDLCYYSNQLLNETIIQPIYFRFNTAQRELLETDVSYNYFRKLYYDELVHDDYDNQSDGFETNKNAFDYVCQRKEGYIYKPHYEIPIKTFSDTITYQKPIYITIKDIDTEQLEIYTLEQHNFTNGDIFYIRMMDSIKHTLYYITCKVTNVINQRKFSFLILSGATDLNKVDILAQGKIIKGDETIPSYAHLSTDGSCYFMWREIIQNGFDNDEKIEQYPFLNGALYVNTNINFFVQRQDPKGIFGLQSSSYPTDPTAKIMTVTNENNYYEEGEIEC